MTKANDFINNLIIEANSKLTGIMANAHGEFNGKKVSVRVSRVNTQSKDNQIKQAFKVNGKVVSLANIVTALEA